MDRVCSSVLVLWAIAGAQDLLIDADCTGIVISPDAESCWYGRYRCCPFNDEAFPGNTAARSRQATDPDLLPEIIGGNASLGLAPLSFKPPQDWHRLNHNQTATLFVLSVDVRRISNIQQKEQNFRMHYVTTVMYRDCRVMQNCSFLTLDDRHPLYGRIWQPRIDIAEREDNIESMSQGYYAMSPDGEVTSKQMQVSTFRCAFDFKDLPLDSHDCRLTFSIAGESLNAVNLEWIIETDALRDSALLVAGIANAEWEIPGREGWSLSQGVEERSVHGAGREPVSTLTAEFTLRRKPRYYILNFILPSTMFWLTSWVGLWVGPAAVPARAALGITPVLIMNNLLNNLAAVLPAISEATRLEQFLTVILFMVLAQLLEFGVVHYCARQEKKLKARKEAAGSEAGNWSAARDRELRLATYAALSLDFHARWIAVLVVAVATIAIFAPS